MKSKPKKRNIWQRMKRAIMIGTIMFAVIAFMLAFYNTSAMFSGRVGGVAAWGLTHSATLTLQTLPVWFWVGLCVALLYLWFRHKILMTVIFGLFGGVVVALII